MFHHIVSSDRNSWRCAVGASRNRLRLSAIVLALCATHIIWAFSYWIAGIDLVVQTGSGNATRTVGSFSVVVATAVAGLAAWGVALLLERSVSRARTLWMAVSLSALAISLLGPLSATTASAAIVLLVMHLTAGLLLIVGFRETLRNRQR